MGVAFVLFMKPLLNAFMGFMESTASTSGEVASEDIEIFRVMEEMYLSQQGYYAFSSITTLIMAGLLLFAGLSLVKRRKKAAKQSNLYAWVAIGFTVLNLPLSLFITLPAQREMQTKMEESMGVPASTGTEQIEMIGQVVGTFIGIIIALIYPILALYFLKRQKVTDYLAQSGT